MQFCLIEEFVELCGDVVELFHILLWNIVQFQFVV